MKITVNLMTARKVDYKDELANVNLDDELSIQEFLDKDKTHKNHIGGRCRRRY